MVFVFEYVYLLGCSLAVCDGVFKIKDVLEKAGKMQSQTSKHLLIDFFRPIQILCKGQNAFNMTVNRE